MEEIFTIIIPTIIVCLVFIVSALLGCSIITHRKKRQKIKSTYSWLDTINLNPGFTSLDVISWRGATDE